MASIFHIANGGQCGDLLLGLCSSWLTSSRGGFTALRAYAISGRSTTLACVIFAFSCVPASIGLVSKQLLFQQKSSGSLSLVSSQYSVHGCRSSARRVYHYNKYE